MKKLAIITTHPIQYNAPFFELLTTRGLIDIKVFYTWGETVLNNKFDPGFGKVIDWDIPLLHGYKYTFLENVSNDKGSHHFNGIKNPNLIKEIENYEPDAVLFYGWSFQSHLKAMRYFKGKIPVFFRGDSHLLTHVGLLNKIKRKLFLTLVYRNIDVAFYVGKNNYNYYKNAFVPSGKLIFAPHSVDNKRFECNETECKNAAKELKNKMGIADGDCVFLFAGKLEPTKNPEILIEVFNSIKIKNWILLIVGNGELEEKLKLMASENNNIKFLDFQNQKMMPALYEISDVFVLPSIGETWGLAVNEAMANGTAIIVSDKCGCAKDLVLEGKNGFTFLSSNAKDLKQKVLMVKEIDLKNAKEESKKIISNYKMNIYANAVEHAMMDLPLTKKRIK